MGGGASNPDRDSFSNYGPLDLTSMDWTNSYHRTSLASSLLEGVYMLELDRQQKRKGSKAQANPWWEFFNFSLVKLLLDEANGSIYGAVFEYDSYTSDGGIPPRYVIAFAGTIENLETWFGFENGIKEIKNIVAMHGYKDVWLVGHSLGASLVLLAGKKMAKSGYPLETYAFNPPISATPPGQLLDSNILKDCFRIGKSIFKSILASISEDFKQIQEKKLKAESWVPYLYVNLEDIVCTEPETSMSEMLASDIESVLIRGGEAASSHILLRLPSANLTVNMNKMNGFKTAHGLEQWWERDSALMTNWKNYSIMPTVKKKEIFIISGPTHLNSIDWTDSYHRTSVVSSLVRGVYIMEIDRQEKREDPQAQANPWWEFFHFSLLETLIDESDNSIYGAIFEYNLYDNSSHLKVLPPRYVVAFRGTLLRSITWFDDVLLDMRCFFNNLHKGPRLDNALEAINRTVSRHGKEVVWLAGHSLGAAIALLTGKIMAMSGCPLEAYIFNPPIASFPLRVLHSTELKFAFRLTCNIVKASIVQATGQDKSEERESFMRLAPWKPYLFVNPLDPICSEYIDHFKNRKTMSKLEDDENFKLPFRFTVKDVSTSAFSPEPLHLVPSAYLITNTSNLPGMRKAHMIRQWWDPTTKVENVLYELNS